MLALATIAGAALGAVALTTAANAASGNGSLTRIDHDRALGSISCPTASFCTAVDADGNALTSNLGRWSRPRDVDQGRQLDSVSCSSASFCAAVDADGDALTYNGTRWSTPTNIRNIMASVSCVSASFCLAVGNNVASTFNGIRWSATGIPKASLLYSVSCSSVSFCLAVDADGNALTYNGTSWSAATNVAEGPDGLLIPLNSVSCVSETFCVAVTNLGAAFTYNGTTWTPTDVRPLRPPPTCHPDLDSVSCSSASAYAPPWGWDRPDSDVRRHLERSAASRPRSVRRGGSPRCPVRPHPRASPSTINRTCRPL